MYSAQTTNGGNDGLGTINPGVLNSGITLSSPIASQRMAYSSHNLARFAGRIATSLRFLLQTVSRGDVELSMAADSGL